MSGKPGRGADQFPLRLPEGMRDLLKETAEANGRSMNAEIVARLQASFGKVPEDQAAQNRRFIQTAEQLVEAMELLKDASDFLEWKKSRM